MTMNSSTKNFAQLFDKTTFARKCSMLLLFSFHTILLYFEVLNFFFWFHSIHHLLYSMRNRLLLQSCSKIVYCKRVTAKEREREKTQLVNGILNASVNIMLWFNHKSFGNATNFGTSHDCPKYIIESINLNHVHWAHFSACHCLLKVSSERGVPTNKTMSNDN